MLQANKLKASLATGREVFGLINSLPLPLMTELIGYAGFDFVILDLEHVGVNPQTLENMIRAVECAGTTALVRVPFVAPNPAQKPQRGQELLYGYRLYWGATAPVRPALATCVATRTGIGGTVGRKPQHWSWRFVVDFAGGQLARIDPKTTTVEPVITASSGSIELKSARPLASVNGVRATFDAVPPPRSGPVTLRLFLRADGQALSETWLYEWTPPAPADRKLSPA